MSSDGSEVNAVRKNLSVSTRLGGEVVFVFLEFTHRVRFFLGTPGQMDHGNPCGLGRGAPRGRPWPHSSGVVRVVSVTPEGIERHSTRRLVTTPLMVEFGVFRLERNSCATVVDLRFVLPCSNNHGRTLETLLHHSSQIRETSSPSFFSRPPPSPSPKPTSVGPPPGA